MQLIIKKLRIFGEKRTKQKMKRKWKNGERIKQKNIQKLEGPTSDQ